MNNVRTLSDVVEDLSNSTTESLFNITWKKVTNGFYGLFQGRDTPSIFADSTEYTPLYTARGYTSENSKYYMCSLLIEDEEVWRKYKLIEGHLEEMVKSAKPSKGKKMKGFTYTTNESNQKYLNIRVYHSIPFKVPHMMYTNAEGEKLNIPIEQFETFMSDHRVKARVVVRPDAVWSFKTSVGIALFATAIVLEDRPAEASESNEDSCTMLLNM